MPADDIRRTIRSTPDGSLPLYASSVVYGGLVVTTQIPDRLDGSIELGDIVVQTEQLFDNLERQLTADGSDLSRLLHVTIYLTDMADRPGFNEVYIRRVPQPVPVRCAVEVAALAIPGMRVEITVLAATS